MTQSDREWMDAVARMGCCVCLREHGQPTPAEVHHLLSGGRRIGHKYTIGLCSPGHHRNGDGIQKISRHPNRARFEAAYGTEAELLEWTRARVEQMQRRAA